MALHPNSFSGKFSLQPGARGEKFSQDMPGYRGQTDRLNRTNNKLNTCEHDVPNIKYELDRRLPVLFRYGWAYGFNQVVVPKGRIVAVDPHMNTIDFDHQKAYNTLTLANGGKNVKLGALKKDASNVDYTDNTLWREAASGTDYTADGTKVKIDPKTGKALDKNGKVTSTVRPANIPIGIIMRNEYTRNDDAYNGMMPGGIQTNCLVEIPWFSDQDTAEENPWGAAYGDFKPGMKVKSDENGRFIPSLLNDPDSKEFPTDVKAYEHERQQVVGEVYEICDDLTPAGSAIYAQWALSDRLNFDEFNPDVYRQNNRDGEDSINNSPFNSDGGYPGYFYEQGYMAHDLHMIVEKERQGRDGVYDPRMQLKYQMENGIPGLTDGKNVYEEVKLNTTGGSLATLKDGITIPKGQKFIFRTLEVDTEKLVMTETPLKDENEYKGKTAVKVGDKFCGKYEVEYVDEKQGIVGIIATDEIKKDDLKAYDTKEQGIQIYFSYTKRGKSGVATNLDWHGCHGTIKVLLQK